MPAQRRSPCCWHWRATRRSGQRTFSVLYIELMRGTPMVAILYVAILIRPMALPEGLSFDKMMRAIFMVMLFWSAYLAEVIRAGLQATPDGQREAATALGLGYWPTADHPAASFPHRHFGHGQSRHRLSACDIAACRHRIFDLLTPPAPRWPIQNGSASTTRAISSPPSSISSSA
ncbi:ABC transporter permease subunit [Sinorhizobium americanum]|uniref:ABC transporter permease subunit n=1 Tax=Sinorhizobium americanum TaxID=194963 RepID=UPI001FD9859A|nr:ABC transporter permease subunit [Sinorhizobium americanum]